LPGLRVQVRASRYGDPRHPAHGHRLGLAAGEIVFLDDVPENAAAASEAGLHAVLHRGAAESIAAVTALLDR
jgi:FMN phosphatase YigB (HAD superfamily)